MKKAKRGSLVIIVFVLIILVILGIFLFGSEENDKILSNTTNQEDNNEPEPPSLPDYMIDQQTAITQALQLYREKKSEGMIFISQCLGIVGNNTKYAVDIVSVPRNSVDNLPENQCSEYRTKQVTHFIELDKEGDIVRIV